MLDTAVRDDKTRVHGQEIREEKDGAIFVPTQWASGVTEHNGAKSGASDDREEVGV